MNWNRRCDLAKARLHDQFPRWPQSAIRPTGEVRQVGDHSGRIGVLGRKRPGDDRISSPERHDRCGHGLVVQPCVFLSVELSQDPGQV